MDFETIVDVHAERPSEILRLKDELVQVMMEMLRLDPNAFTMIYEAQQEALYLTIGRRSA